MSTISIISIGNYSVKASITLVLFIGAICSCCVKQKNIPCSGSFVPDVLNVNTYTISCEPSQNIEKANRVQVIDGRRFQIVDCAGWENWPTIKLIEISKLKYVFICQNNERNIELLILCKLTNVLNLEFLLEKIKSSVMRHEKRVPYGQNIKYNLPRLLDKSGNLEYGEVIDEIRQFINR